MADPKQKSSLTLAQIDEALKRILDGSIASVNGINPNLLDNWDFANPVNQKGRTEYADSGYCIDRWRSNTSKVKKIVVKNDCFKLDTIESTYGWIVYEAIEASRLVGKKLTASVLAGNITGPAWSLLVSYRNASDSEIGSDSIRISGGLTQITVTVPANTAFVRVGVYASSSNYVHPGDSVSFYGAKLEIESAQTLAHQDVSGNWVLNEIPDYGEQLLKCQRYYQLFSGADARPSDLADYRPSMRANPAVGTIDIGGKTYYFSDANL